jgi:hypothetical protein
MMKGQFGLEEGDAKTFLSWIQLGVTVSCMDLYIVCMLGVCVCDAVGALTWHVCP